jgi:23S rRNA pseudouridine2605 synthase
VAGMPDERALEKLRTGVPLDGKRTLPAQVLLLNSGRRDADGVLIITITEGRNRQVRRMLEAVGHPVDRLKRTKIGPIGDRKLPVGAWRDLSAEEVRKLKAAARPDESVR